MGQDKKEGVLSKPCAPVEIGEYADISTVPGIDQQPVPRMNGLFRVDAVPDEKRRDGDIEAVGNGGQVISPFDNVDDFISAG